MEMPKGLVLVLHNGFAKIAIEECLQVLPPEWIVLHREIVEINYSQNLELQKLYETGYSQYALEHKRQYNTVVLPLLNNVAGYKIVYFGLAPIPLAIDLGHLFHNYRDIDIYQKHHVSKEWYKDLQNQALENNPVKTDGLPDRNQKGIADALIRLSISHSINPDDTYEILPNAAEININLENPNEDAIENKEKMVEIGEAVKMAFDELSNNRSDLKRIHLFASIPCGVAFLIGTKISPNIHPYIQTYQHSRTKEPKYVKALLIKGQITAERKITEESKKAADEVRKFSNDELTLNIKKYCDESENMSRGGAWYQGLMPKLNPGIMSGEFWKNIPALYETSLKNDTFDFETLVVNDGFSWRNNKWFVDDIFFISLKKRLGNREEILKAIRLFLFHEALHYAKHRLTDLTSVNIGSFPKVLETADYQADVYGIMNEYGYHTKMNGEITNYKEFFLKSIRVATETMWSFDDNGSPLEEIQIRRLSRYMIWYLQYARIEKNGNTIDDIISILEQKPVIELNGLKSKEENNRFFFELEKRQDQPLELAFFHENEIIRDASATNMPIESLVQGIRELNGELILNVMRSFISR